MTRYVDPAAFENLPPAVDWTTKVTLPYGMLGNDKYGNCTAAALGHCEQIWTAAAGTEKVVQEQEVVDFATVAGALQGAAMLDVLNLYLKVGIAGDKAQAFVAFDSTPANLKYAIAMFGAAYIGVALPVTAQNQDVWDFVPDVSGNAANGWGGHATSLHGYEPGRWRCVTWGSPKWMTDAFIAKYADEAYAVLSADWLDAGGAAPSGFNLAQLQADLALIRR